MDCGSDQIAVSFRRVSPDQSLMLRDEREREKNSKLSTLLTLLPSWPLIELLKSISSVECPRKMPNCERC